MRSLKVTFVAAPSTEVNLVSKQDDKTKQSKVRNLFPELKWNGKERADFDSASATEAVPSLIRLDSLLRVPIARSLSP